ncbi:unnamed protein product [Boreogadus saida]
MQGDNMSSTIPRRREESDLVSNITLEGSYSCHRGPLLSLDQLCDFVVDCPLGDDEGDVCRRFLNGSYCSFEDEDCGWRSVTGRGATWRRLQTPVKPSRLSCPSSGAALALILTLPFVCCWLHCHHGFCPTD